MNEIHRLTVTNGLLLTIIALAAAACGGAQAGANAPEGTTGPATFSEQVAAGQSLYQAKCAACHGAQGRNGKGPPVVGLKDGALPLDPPATAKHRTTQFKTVADVADFVVKSMPPNAPGSLSAEEYWSILAFDLKANGVDLGDKKLTPELAAASPIPR